MLCLSGYFLRCLDKTIVELEDVSTTNGQVVLRFWLQAASNSSCAYQTVGQSFGVSITSKRRPYRHDMRIGGIGNDKPPSNVQTK
ncbi:unnamed protein product [Protopolystoma xenopodis]|uniref:Uncharacterized protein n=1 Tax=Protopolystoma xenopodis TaxID=117903 RepID=A0A3S5BSY5_9PLAT|nr:unnamed protein product [Protopolystoma xenopodis]